MELRQILRGLSKTYKGRTKIRELLARHKHRLTNSEYWLIEYTYIKEESVYQTCELLGFSKTLYHTTLNRALSKLDILIDDATMRDLIKIF